ncbi:MAG: VWA domain-containing protein [Firmicutes bacterium]|nr:VWA domain-containing protein [Bacillota bacterium]
MPDPRTLPAYLRAAGMDVSPAEIADALRALAAWPGSLDGEEAVRRLRVALARDAEGWRVLPALLRAWQRGEAIERVAGASGAGGRAAPVPHPDVGRRRGALRAGPTAAGEGEEGSGEGRAGPDAVERDRAPGAGRDPRPARGASEGTSGPAAPAGAGRELAAAVRRYARATEPPAARRRRPLPRGRLDLGRTWRRSLRTHGELLRFGRTGRPRPRAERVLLVDTSASMREQDGFFAALGRALARPPAGAEVRAFDVSLRPGRWPGAEVGGEGGTRIGASLLAYLRGPGRRLGRHSHVMIVSDGWETGDIAVLERALGALVRRAGRVDWLCPLAGTEGFRPTCRGLVAALRQGIGVYDVHDAQTFLRYVEGLEASRRVGGGRAPAMEVGEVG